MKKKLFSFLLLLCGVYAAWAQQWPKCVLAGDYPDPSVMREGRDFYMTHSPFVYQPGFLIWHSTDLMNWTPVGRALESWKGSAMAPDLLKYGDKYYIYFPSNGTNYVTWASDIRGPWSEPVDLHVSGIDPGHAADEQGNRYLFLNRGEMIRLAPDGLSTVGEKKKVYEGWEIPKQWNTEGKWPETYLESPKIIRHGDYYYLTCAEGGTAGPATSHMAVSARSRSLEGPWENSPYNPVVHTYSAQDHWWSKGHGTLIDDAEGRWWMVYHAYAKGYHTLGRQTLIEPMEWTRDGWFRASAGAVGPCPEPSTFPVLSDNFHHRELGWQWSFWKENARDMVTLGDGQLVVPGKGTSPADGRLMLITAQHKNYEAEVTVKLPGKGQAGLLLYYSEQGYTGVAADASRFYVYDGGKLSATVKNTFGRKVRMKVLNRANRATVSVSRDGKDWTVLAEGLDVTDLNHNKLKKFFALRPALFVAGKGKAAFSDFQYKDAVPKEEDMAAYLMVYHLDEDHGLHMALSRDGYTFTALNDNKPVMAGDTIAEQLGIRDPHIYRGPDGAFYLSMTDLHIFAKRDGKRETEWERDGKLYGWGNNRGLVLMKSFDLLHWKRTNVRFDRMSAAWQEIGCAWAPETIFDETTGRLMIYLTMRHRNEPNKLYYCYVNDEYDTIETLPSPLFQYADERKSAIDGDITKFGDKYILSYVAHDVNGGIKLAYADRPTGPWHFDPRWVDFEPRACEAPHVFKRIGEDKWVLMYDVYSISPHNFGFIETSDFDSFISLGRFNEGVMQTRNFASPKHGAVVHLTEQEARRLCAQWGTDYDALPSRSEGKRADKPLYRDPVFDGAADPVLIYNKERKAWWMFYTNRRANMEGGRGVEWVHGTPIGIAESTDGGASWHYVQDAKINYGKERHFTYWAPDVIETDGRYHMFLTVVPGIFPNWNHPREIVHLESTDLIDWTFKEKCGPLVSDRVIDASLFKNEAGEWFMYYNNEADGKTIWLAKSNDLRNWKDMGQVIRDKRGEGAKVFRWHERYWMIVDNWDGQGVYSSDDLVNWKRQQTPLLDKPGVGVDDEVIGNHADVVVQGDRAFIFYFTHPERNVPNYRDHYGTRRSSIQVAELEYVNGELRCNRDKPVYIGLSN